MSFLPHPVPSQKLYVSVCYAITLSWVARTTIIECYHRHHNWSRQLAFTSVAGYCLLFYSFSFFPRALLFTHFEGAHEADFVMGTHKIEGICSPLQHSVMATWTTPSPWSIIVGLIGLT